MKKICLIMILLVALSPALAFPASAQTATGTASTTLTHEQAQQLLTILRGLKEEITRLISQLTRAIASQNRANSARNNPQNNPNGSQNQNQSQPNSNNNQASPQQASSNQPNQGLGQGNTSSPSDPSSYQSPSGIPRYPSDTLSSAQLSAGNKMKFDCNTWYYAGENGEPYTDMMSKPLQTLEAYLKDPRNRYVSTALPGGWYVKNGGPIIPGTHLRIPALESRFGGKYIDFRAVDTGSGLTKPCPDGVSTNSNPNLRRVDINSYAHHIKNGSAGVEVQVLSEQEAAKLRLERDPVPAM